MYKDLGMKDRMKIIKNGVKKGLAPEYSVKLYDINDNGGFNQWKKDMAKTQGIDVDRDKNYNYELFYNDNPSNAWDIVNGNKEFLIPNIYRLVNTPQNPEMYANLDYDNYVKNINLQFNNQFAKGGKTSQASRDRYNAYLWNLAKPFYHELLNIGLSPVAAIGILGNIALESGFNKNASNGTHFGYLQNSTGIRNWIKSLYGGYDHEHQLRYMLDGLTGNLKGAKTSYGRMLGDRFKRYIDAVKDVTDPIEAVRLWERFYEISGGLAMAEREGYGKYFYDLVGQNNNYKPEATDVIKLATPKLTELQLIQNINPNLSIDNIKPKPIDLPLVSNNMYTLPPSINYLMNMNNQLLDTNDNLAAFYLIHNRNKQREDLAKLIMTPVNYTDDYING